MVTLVQTFQTSLPMGLFDRLQRLRRRYGAALKAAASGTYTGREQQLRTVSRTVSSLLADEAKKSLEDRGGLRMVDLLLAVDGLFPELRGWNQYEALQRHKQRMAGDQLGLPAPVVPVGKVRSRITA
ncbi:MAG TPA: hypothetical protein VK464_11725 [Symbiobacteriaceae bacterium]|nr:hypothetical protein [Symbiobacteriaceae bacterium]